ncbi:MAG: hypothetical protein HYX74_08595 [Acidobacteria bacterium]|nr:hypothetical protein [Acidobacteriota bacterium]
MFARIDAVALGISVGALLGLGLCAASIVLLLKGGVQVGSHLALLAQYFPGYSVSWKGSFAGLFYGFVTGFIWGWATAFLRNLVVMLYLSVVRLWATLSSINHYLDRF